MQVWLSRIAAVADETEHVSGFRDLAHVYGNSSPLHMPQDDPCSSAFENDVIADHVRSIRLGRGHVSRAVFREHDSPLTRRQDRIAIDEVRRRIGRKKPLDAKTDAVDAHEVHAVTLPAVRRESLPFERAQMRV